MKKTDADVYRNLQQLSGCLYMSSSHARKMNMAEIGKMATVLKEKNLSTQSTVSNNTNIPL